MRLEPDDGRLSSPVLRGGERSDSRTLPDKSAMLAVERLRKAGYTVDRVIALVDRDQGGTQLYQSAGLEFRAIFSLVEIQENLHSHSK